MTLDKRRLAGYSRGIAYVVLLFFFAATSHAADTTHLAVPPRDLVTLEMANDVRGGCGEARLDFFRLQPDGTSDTAAFRIPQGKALVVTEMDWHYSSGVPGLWVALSVVVQNLDDPAKQHRAAESPVRLGPDGVGGASERFTSGFPVASGARLCVEMVNAPIGSPIRLSKVLLRGYLVDEP